jgi:hypothetical protein
MNDSAIKVLSEEVASLLTYVNEQKARIEKLEAALRWIIAKTDDRLAAEFAKEALSDRIK